MNNRKTESELESKKKRDFWYIVAMGSVFFLLIYFTAELVIDLKVSIQGEQSEQQRF